MKDVVGCVVSHTANTIDRLTRERDEARAQVKMLREAAQAASEFMQGLGVGYTPLDEALARTEKKP